MRTPWTYAHHDRWSDYVIYDRVGWVICVVGSEDLAKFIVERANRP